ncbi:MAG: hypothetical protein A2V64_03090 [Bacteroidetes bacterium RBG_13_43_22]|nr:MAG: hypothetical protein A2V64_03090 [Bacteroidetes bacterium RBG_13_43_22]
MLIGINNLSIELMKTKIFLIITALAIILFSSCKKDTVLDQTSVDLADDDAVSDAIFEDVFNTVDYADIILDGFQKGESSKSGAFVVLADSCPEVTITHPSDAVWPKTITVDYGTGCTGFFENTRAGKIIIVVSGPRRETGSKRTITFDNYYINGIKVEGTHELENKGFNTNQNLLISATLTGGKVTLPDGKTIQRSFEHVREWTAGLLSKNPWDDECLITGTAAGVNINGVAYTKTILTALHWKRVCRFVVSGVIEIETAGPEPFKIDFGTGDCDAVATVTRGDDSREITLRYRHRLMGN